MNILIKGILGFFVLFLCALPEASATNIFVDKNLSGDCATGNYSIINRTCTGIDGKAYNTIAEAISPSSAGDIIYIRSGTYIEDVTIPAAETRTAGNETVLTVGTPGAPETVIWNSAGGASPGLMMYANYWIVDGRVSDPVHDTAGLTIVTNSSDSEYNAGVRIGGSSTACKGTIFKHVKFYSTSDKAALLTSENVEGVLFQDCIFWGSSYKTIESKPRYSRSTAFGYNMKFEKCKIVSNGDYGHDNNCYEVMHSRTWFVANNSSKDGCLMHNRGGAYSRFENCIFETPAGYTRPAIFLRPDDSHGAQMNIRIMNNTFVAGGEWGTGKGCIFFAWGTSLSPDHSGVIIQNNLFIGGTGASKIFDSGDNTWTAFNCVIQNNTKREASVSWGTYGTYTWGSGNKTEPVSYAGSGNKPSPFWNLNESYDGSSANMPPSTDYDDKPRGTPPDLGAFESVKGVAPRAPTGLILK
jgi:hypothetical protein